MENIYHASARMFLRQTVYAIIYRKKLILYATNDQHVPAPFSLSLIKYTEIIILVNA